MRKLVTRVIVVLLAALLVLAMYVTAHVVATPGTPYFTDGATIRQELAGAPLRRVLWNPPLRLAAPVGSGEDEHEAHVSPDGRTLFFARGRPGRNADLYIATRETTGWSTPRPLTALNTPADELGPALAPDGRTLYFHSNRAGGRGGYDLWAAMRDDGDGWLPAVNLGDANSPEDEYGATVAPDGSALYFASNRSGAGDESAHGDATVDRDYDIYVVALDGDAAPRPLDDLNSPFDEGAPALSPVGDFLYFASNRPGGRGAFDLYRARRMPDGFDPPENLDAPVNTADNEIDPAVAEQGFVLLFSSDRAHGDGDVDAGADTNPRGYDLFSSASREVFRATEDRRVPWAAIFRLIAPILPWVVLGIILALLLPFMFRLLRGNDPRLRPLSIVARCLLLSLFAHVVIVLVCMAWAVASGIPELTGRSTGGTQVALTSPANGAGLVAQIRGDLAEADPLEPTVKELERQTVGDDEASEPSPAELAPGTLFALAEAPRPAKNTDDAAPRRSVAPVRDVDVLVAPPPAPAAAVRTVERVASREAVAPGATIVSAAPTPSAVRRRERDAPEEMPATPMPPAPIVVDVSTPMAAARSPGAAPASPPRPPARRPDLAAARVPVFDAPDDAPRVAVAAQGRDSIPIEPARADRTRASAPAPANDVRVSVAPEVGAPGAPRPTKIVRGRLAPAPAPAAPAAAPARRGDALTAPLAALPAPETGLAVAGAEAQEAAPVIVAAAPLESRSASAPGPRAAGRVDTRVTPVALPRVQSRAEGLPSAGAMPVAPATPVFAITSGIAGTRPAAAATPALPVSPVEGANEAVTDALAFATAPMPSASRVGSVPVTTRGPVLATTRRLPPGAPASIRPPERVAGPAVLDARIGAPVAPGVAVVPAPAAPRTAALSIDLAHAAADAGEAVEATRVVRVPTATGGRGRWSAPPAVSIRSAPAAIAAGARPALSPRDQRVLPRPSAARSPAPSIGFTGVAVPPTVAAAPPAAAPTLAAPTLAAPTLAAPTLAAPTLAAPTLAMAPEAARETEAELRVVTTAAAKPVLRIEVDTRPVRSSELAPASSRLDATRRGGRPAPPADARAKRSTPLGPMPTGPTRARGAVLPITVPPLQVRVTRRAVETPDRADAGREGGGRATPAPPDGAPARVARVAPERKDVVLPAPDRSRDERAAAPGAPARTDITPGRRDPARFAPPVEALALDQPVPGAGDQPRVEEVGDELVPARTSARRRAQRDGDDASPPTARLARIPAAATALDAKPRAALPIASVLRSADAPRFADVPARAGLLPVRPSLVPLLPPVPTRPETPYPQRAAERRPELLAKHGGDARTERAVADALDWLMRHQSEDGRWDGDGYDEGCGRCPGAARREVSVAVTALALLSYFAANHTHVGDGPYFDTVSRGLAWLLEQQSDRGDFISGETMYTHGAATIALAEAYGLTGDEALLEPLERAVAFVVSARNSFTGGWRYVPGQDGDTSVLGWQVMALISARRAGLDVPEEALRGAEKWLRRVSDPTAPGRYAYRPTRAPTPSMTAEGMYVQQLLGVPRDDPMMEGSVALLLENPPEWKQSQSSYYWFYSSLALFQHGGPAWTVWNRRMKETLLAGQVKSGAAAGSWPPDDVWAQVGGRVYQTALCALTLEVYYRYLPLYVVE